LLCLLASFFAAAVAEEWPGRCAGLSVVGQTCADVGLT